MSRLDFRRRPRWRRGLEGARERASFSTLKTVSSMGRLSCPVLTPQLEERFNAAAAMKTMAIVRDCVQ